MKKMLALMVAILFALSVTLAIAAEPAKTDTTAPAKITDKAAEKKDKAIDKAADKKAKADKTAAKKDAKTDKKDEKKDTKPADKK